MQITHHNKENQIINISSIECTLTYQNCQKNLPIQLHSN